MLLKIILSVLLVLSQIGDIYLTESVLRHGGVELNPIIKRYGYWIKIPATAFAVGAGIIFHPFIIVPPLVIMVGVCVWNYVVLRRQKT